MDLLQGRKMLDLLIAIPLGVSTENTPIQEYLETCINSILEQKTKYNYKIVAAADKNIPTKAVNFLSKNNIEISWYEPYFYFRKGGIWKKIYDQWLKYDSEYVAFSHYDDMWDENKIQNQIDFLIKENLEICWSKVFQIDSKNNIISNDLSFFDTLNLDTFNQNSHAFCHSSITKKQSILNCGITKHMDDWSGIYEKLFFMYSHKLVGKKCKDAIFYHRSHNKSITNTFANESSKDIINQREITGYSLQETINDINKINFDVLKAEIFKK